METCRFGTILKRARGGASLASFARRLGVSPTHARSMIESRRLPSERLLAGIAQAIGVEYDRLLLAVYADRSPVLADALENYGLDPDLVVDLSVKEHRKRCLGPEGDDAGPSSAKASCF